MLGSGDGRFAKDLDSNMTHRNRNTLLVSLFFTTTLLMLLRVSRKPHRINVSVSYRCAKNYQHWGMCAFFEVTNNSRFTVKRWPGLNVEDRRTGISSIAMLQHNQLLGTGEGETIVIPMPTNQGPWRFGISVSQNGLRAKFAECVAVHTWSQYTPSRLLAVPSESVNSDWVAN